MFLAPYWSSVGSCSSYFYLHCQWCYYSFHKTHWTLTLISSFLSCHRCCLSFCELPSYFFIILLFLLLGLITKSLYIIVAIEEVFSLFAFWTTICYFRSKSRSILLRCDFNISWGQGFDVMDEVLQLFWP